MQLLPHGMQELLRMVAQKKAASERLIRDQQELMPMRPARVRAEIRRRVVCNIALNRFW
jgi:hypothetical protein